LIVEVQNEVTIVVIIIDPFTIARTGIEVWLLIKILDPR